MFKLCLGDVVHEVFLHFNTLVQPSMEVLLTGHNLNTYSFNQSSKFNFIEILILHTYFCGQFAFVTIIFTSLTPLFISFEIAGFKIMDLLLQLPYWYLFIRMQKEFFSETWNKAILKGLVILIFGTATYLLFLFLLFNGIKYVL